MTLPEEGALLRIFVGESDRHEGKLLYEWLVVKAKERGLAGATVLRGVMGFGAHSRLHTFKIERLSEDLPVIVEIVDVREKLEAFLEEIEGHVPEGLATLEKAFVRFYRGGEAAGPMSGFSLLDWAVVILYMGGIAAFGLFKGGKQASAKDYFLSEKKIGWWAVTASIVATETSALTFISVPGMAFKGAWGFLELSFGYLLGRTVIAWVLLPRYFEGELTTSYALLERKFGVGVRRMASGTFILTRIFADGVRLYATAIPLVIIFRGYNLFSGVTDVTLYVVAILLTAAVTVVYVQVGGVRAVIWTDVIQLGVYILGGLVAIFVLVPKIPELGAKLAAAAAAGKLTVFQTDGGFLTSPYHVLTAILGGAVLSMASHGTDYIIVQRLFSTESLRDSRRALVASGIVVILQFALFLAVGTLLFLFYGPLELKGDAVFPKFIVEQVPSGLSGLIIAGLLAAAMSTISGSISSISSSTVFDLYASTKRGRAATEEHKLRLSRRVSFVWAILLTGAALIFIGTGQAVVELALSIASFTYGGFLGLFFLAVRGKTTSRSAAIGFLSGVGVMVFVVLGTKLAWPLYTLAGSLVTVAVAWTATFIEGRARTA